jgi:hypothetical protein
MTTILKRLAERLDITPDERRVLLAAADFIASVEVDNTAGIMDDGEDGRYCSCLGNVDVPTLETLGFDLKGIHQW